MALGDHTEHPGPQPVVVVSTYRIMKTTAVYLGTQPGFENLPPVDLYNLVTKVGRHPVGSTVSRKTLEDHGVIPPGAADPLAAQSPGKPKRGPAIS